MGADAAKVAAAPVDVKVARGCVSKMAAVGKPVTGCDAEAAMGGVVSGSPPADEKPGETGEAGSISRAL